MYRLNILLILLLLLVVSCPETPQEPEWNNPTDPDIPGTYVEPETEIKSGPGEASTIHDHMVTFVFSGNKFISQYSWKLDNNDWSGWSVDSSVTLSYLDEGNHEFQVKGRYNVMDEDDTPALRNFVIDAVQGPALLFKPRKVSIASGGTFTVDVLVEEVENLAGVMVDIGLTSDFELLNYSLYESSIDFLSKDCNNFLTIVNPQEQKFTALIGRVSDSVPGVNGSGEIVQLNFKYNGSINTALSFGAECELQDPEMKIIPLNETVECVIEVTE